MRDFRTLGILATLSVFSGVSQAGTTVWAFNASNGNPHIQAYDLDTGAAIADFPAPNNDALRGRANGRGIAVVGTTIYYSLADSPNVYVTDTAGQADRIAFVTPLSPGINSLAWDGTSLWLVASQPTDPTKPADGKVYQYSPTGTLLKTLAIQRPVNSNLAPNGIEVTPAGLMVNQGSVPYDVYDINTGRLLQPGLITATFRTTGVAFDGTNYIVCDVFHDALAVYNAAGTFLRSVVLTGSSIPFGIVDLAVVPSGPPATGPQFTAAGVANAGSYATGVVAPGEIVSIFGSGLGPDAPVSLTLNNAGLVSNAVAGTRVLFDGIPAPIVFTSSKQVNVVVPYSVAGTTSVQTEFLGVRSSAVPIRVAASVPGILTANGSGTGQGAILNQDFSVNSASNPASKGSIVMIYATGEGQTNPGGVDGKVAAAVPFPAPLLPVSATIDNVTADVRYAGAAPNLVAGVLQVNVRIPANAASGNLPVVLQVGTASSRTGVTVAVQ